LSLFSLPKTIESAVGTEKHDRNSKKAKLWKKILTKKESAGETKEPAEKTKEPAGKSTMTRLCLNKSQREGLNKWFGTARWTYNQVVASICTSPRDISKYAVVKEL
jgi:ParB-like chromosome segregation protein Spo0J